jgi:hypothetical protein
LLSLAAQHGVKRIVALSAVTVEFGGGHRRFAHTFRAVEDATKTSGMGGSFCVARTLTATLSLGLRRSTRVG